MKLNDSYFAYDKNIWKKNVCNLVCGLKLAIPYLFAKNSTILSQNSIFCLFFVYIASDCEYFQNFMGALTL